MAFLQNLVAHIMQLYCYEGDVVGISLDFLRVFAKEEVFSVDMSGDLAGNIGRPRRSLQVFQSATILVSDIG